MQTLSLAEINEVSGADAAWLTRVADVIIGVGGVVAYVNPIAGGTLIMVGGGIYIGASFA